MSRTTFAAALFPVLAQPPHQAVAGPPEGVPGKMAFDEVADGLRRYRAEKDRGRRVTWLWRLGKCSDLRVAVAMGDALSDPSEEVRYAAAAGLWMCRTGQTLHRRPWANPTLFQVERLEWAKDYWRQCEDVLRRRAAQPPR
jgi:hypothetical protein